MKTTHWEQYLPSGGTIYAISMSLTATPTKSVGHFTQTSFFLSGIDSTHPQISIYSRVIYCYAQTPQFAHTTS